MDNIVTKIKKLYLKLLKAQCNKKWNKARNLHAKIIGLELELKVREQKHNN